MLIPKLIALNTIIEDWGENDDDFWITVQADIAVDNRGSEVFTFTVVSPVRLGLINRSAHVIIGRSMLITSDFDIEKVKETIGKILMGIKGESWDEIITQISRYSRSEYE